MVPPVQVSPLIKVNQASRPPLGARLRAALRVCDATEPGTPAQNPLAAPQARPPCPPPAPRAPYSAYRIPPPRALWAETPRGLGRPCRR